MRNCPWGGFRRAEFESEHENYQFLHPESKKTKSKERGERRENHYYRFILPFWYLLLSGMFIRNFQVSRRPFGAISWGNLTPFSGRSPSISRSNLQSTGVSFEEKTSPRVTENPWKLLINSPVIMTKTRSEPRA